jgi:hypothetical protein
MPRYELNRLGAAEFENLVQALIKEIIGDGTITFGAGPDGAREATYEGSAPYPSSTDQWSGTWIFQAKFHDTELQGTDKCRKALIKDVEGELEKIINKYNFSPDNYIVATNVPLSPAHESGTLDTIHRTVFSKYRDNIKRLAIWGADDINRFLEKYPNVRTSYLHLIVPGDLIAWLMDERQRNDDEIATTMEAYLRGMFGREQNAQLDQAGDVADEPVKLQQVFFELHATLSSQPQNERRYRRQTYLHILEYVKNANIGGDGIAARIPVVQLFLACGPLRVVLVGGPGEGKSTVGQYLAQLHRAQLLGEIADVAISETYYPVLPRLPFRVILRDFAQWLSESRDADSNSRDGTLEDFICEQIKRVTARSITANTLHEMLRKNPSLLILDGLDEVTDSTLKKDVTDRADEFVTRIEKVLKADLQVLATTRPTGYNDQFSPDIFAHLALTDLEPDQVRNYVRRWILARGLDDSRAQRLPRSIEDCLHDRQIRLLMNTPLQVTILVLIITAGGTPPRQREALFNEYLEVIYKREQGKGTDIITTNKELLVGLHKYIGYELQERATRAFATNATLPRVEYSRLVAEFIAWNDPYSSNMKRQGQLRSITIDAGERLVLIVEPSAGRFGFELRPLQEFFAACHLIDTSKDTVQRYQRFEAIARFPHWQNVALFSAGRVGRNFPGEASNIVEVCKNIDREGVDVYIRRGAQLALEIAFDRAFLPNRRLQQSILEVALDVLESKISWERRDNVTKLLRDMPEEDISDHIVPLLEKKLSALAPEGLANSLHVMTVIDPNSETMLAAMRRMIENSESRSQVLQPLLRVAGIRPNSLPLVRELMATLGVDRLAEYLAQLQGINEHLHALNVFKQARVPVEQQHQIVRHAARVLRSLIIGSTARASGAWSGSWDQVGSELLLRMVEAVAFCSRVESPRRKISDEPVSDVWDQYRVRLPRTVIGGDGVGFADAAEVSENDALNAPMWILHLLLGDVTAYSMRRAISFFRTNAHDEYVKSFLVIDWRITPVFDYIASRFSAGGDEDESEMADLLMRWSGAEGGRRWRLFKNHLLRRSAKRSRKAAGNLGATTTLRGDHVSLDTPEAQRVELLQEAGDPDLLIYATTDTRMRLDALKFVFGDAPSQVEAIFGGSYITSAKEYAIYHLCRLGNSENIDAFSLRKSILTRLLALGRTYSREILEDALVACYEVGTLEDGLAVAALRYIGQKPRGVQYIPITAGTSTSSLYQKMLHFAARSKDEDVSRGACRVIHGTSFAYSLDRAGLRSPRFSGLAAMHQELCASSDREARMAAIGLFVIRKSWPQSAGESITMLFRQCESDDEVALLSRLIESEIQFEERLFPVWRQLFTDLLPDRLYGSLNLEVQDALNRVLQTTNQSLEAWQKQLGLPLASAESE